MRGDINGMDRSESIRLGMAFLGLAVIVALGVLLVNRRKH